MKNLSFYDQVAVVVPGGVLFFIVMLVFPPVREVLTKDGFNVGGLGVYLVVSYGGGHIVAAVGNIVEAIYWTLRGGVPSSWIVGCKPRLLYPAQINRLEALISFRLGLEPLTLRSVATKAWHPIFRQIYAEVSHNGKPQRADVFNGLYGLNRGLGAAMLVAVGLVLVRDYHDWQTSLGLLTVGLVFFYRMHRFGVHYAREVLVQFLTLGQDMKELSKTSN